MTLDEALAEIESLKAKNSELSNNLTNQRKAHEAEKEQLATKAAELEKTIADRDAAAAAELTKYTEDRIKAIAKGDEQIAEKIKSEYGILNMPEGSREEIDARALKAYQSATLTSVNPLAQQVDTLAPSNDGGSQGEDGKLTSAGADVYQRMFPNSKAVTEGQATE